MAVALSATFAQIGHQVEVICLDGQCGSSHELLFAKVLQEHHVNLRFLGRKKKWPGLLAAAKLWWIVQRGRFDVVHSHLSMPDALVGLIRRITVTGVTHVLTVHSTIEPRSQFRAALAGGSNVVYCSQAAQRKSRPLLSVSSTVIPNGISQSDYLTAAGQRAETRQQLGVPIDAPVVMLAGRLCRQKRFDLSLDALRVLHERKSFTNLHYLCCGDGEERDRLVNQSRCAGLDDVLRFCGSRTDISAMFGASDVFLSTSLFEGMPLVVLEALTAGLPCVLSTIDEHYEIAGNMPGCIFVQADDPESVASALAACLEMKVSPSALRRERASLLEKYSIDGCARSYLSLYESLSSQGQNLPVALPKAH